MYDDFLDSKALAKRWKISSITLRHWRVSGTGPKFNKFGGRVKYHIDDIEHFEKSTRRAHTTYNGCSIIRVVG